MGKEGASWSPNAAHPKGQGLGVGEPTGTWVPGHKARPWAWPKPLPIPGGGRGDNIHPLEGPGPSPVDVPDP